MANPWNGLCPAGLHGLDYEGQRCDLCPDILKPFGIGSKVWTYDRYARRGDSGVVEYEVTGETRMSWIIKGNNYHEYKLPKKGDGDTRTIKVSNYGTRHQTFYLARKAFEDAQWRGRNQYFLSKHIDSTYLSADVLREVAKLVGYTEKTED